jgi:hypothetical protein
MDAYADLGASRKRQRLEDPEAPHGTGQPANWAQGYEKADLEGQFSSSNMKSSVAAGATSQKSANTGKSLFLIGAFTRAKVPSS